MEISVIFTSYNHADYLRQAIDSILAQTFQNFELIIVDDNSTDGSQKILLSYKDPRIKLYLRNTNSGNYVLSSNYGASKATSPYIIFAQCDDFAEKDQLRKLYQAFKIRPSIGVVFSCSRLVDESGNFLNYDFNIRERNFRIKHKEDGLIQSEDMKNYLYHSCVIPNLSAALIKRSLFQKLNGFSSRYLVLADWDFWIKISKLCDFYYIREPLNNFRQHKTTIRKSIHLKLQIEELLYMFYNINTKENKPSIISINYDVSIIWLNFCQVNPQEWFTTFFYILKRAICYSKIFPLSLIVAIIYYPFFIVKRIIKRIFNYLIK